MPEIQDGSGGLAYARATETIRSAPTHSPTSRRPRHRPSDRLSPPREASLFGALRLIEMSTMRRLLGRESGQEGHPGSWTSWRNALLTALRAARRAMRHRPASAVPRERIGNAHMKDSRCRAGSVLCRTWDVALSTVSGQ